MSDAPRPVDESRLLIDVGSTVIKLCARSAADRFGPVERVPRQPGVAAGEQVRTLVAQRRQRGEIGPVRICSSANGGLRIGIVGLSRRHSAQAAARAVLEAGGNVVYARLLSEQPPTPPVPVDVLVLVGGIDGADHHRLRAALAAHRLADYPRDVLVWAGADAPELVAGLPIDRQAANVLDQHLRPRLHGLADTIRDIYVEDLVDRKGLGALVELAEAPIWPTPAVVALAAARMSRQPVPPAPTTPFVVIDVGGATTDSYACAELRADHSARSSPGESIVRQVFTDLGVASSGAGLLSRLATEPNLYELACAVAPANPRTLYHALSEGRADALAPPVGFLTCLFLALRRLVTAEGPHRVELGRAASFVITGGACGQTPLPAIRRVIEAAGELPGASFAVLLDADYLLWARGIQDVPGRPGCVPAAVGGAAGPGLAGGASG